MKKIVFLPIRMQKTPAQVYAVDDNKSIEYEEKVTFPMNGVLAKTLQKDDDVKIIKIITQGKMEHVLRENAEILEKELNELNKGIGAKISYEEIVTPFEETSQTIEKRFRQFLDVLEDGCEIMYDMTFGPKTLTPVLFYVLEFAERFFNADIKGIYYTKIEFDGNIPIDGTGKIFDMTSLFYLNSLTSVMEAPDSKTALARLDKFFAM